MFMTVSLGLQVLLSHLGENRENRDANSCTESVREQACFSGWPFIGSWSVAHGSWSNLGRSRAENHGIKPLIMCHRARLGMWKLIALNLLCSGLSMSLWMHFFRTCFTVLYSFFPANKLFLPPLDSVTASGWYKKGCISEDSSSCHSRYTLLGHSLSSSLTRANRILIAFMKLRKR